jgi:hypothetical protein
VRSVLTAHEIAFHISGENHAAMVGLGAAAIAQVVWVAREQAEEAAALIDELRRGGAGELADDEIPVDDQAERLDHDPADSAALVATDDTLLRLGVRKRTMLAIAVGVFLGHGTAHFSTRLWGRGAVLAGVQVMGWRALFVGNPRLGAGLVLGVIAMDVLGAIVHIHQTARPALPAARIRRRLP